MQLKHFAGTMVLLLGIIFNAFSQNYLINEGFSGGLVAPPGWTFTGLDVYTSSAGSGQAVPSLKFDGTGDQLITPTFSNADEVSFWLKGYSVDAASALVIEYKQNSSWLSLQTITGIPTTGIPYQINLPSSATQLRFTYNKSAGNIAFDDLKVRESVITALPQINVSYNNQPIINSQTILAGTVTAGSALPLTFTLENNGTVDLTLHSIQASGDTYISSFPATVLKPSQSSQLILNFNTATAGNKTGTVIIQNSSTNQPIFEINVEATVTAPVIAMPVGVTPKNGDLRTAGSTILLNNQSTTLEEYQNGNWQVFTATVPTSATLYALHSLTISGHNQLAKIVVAGNSNTLLASGGSLASSQQVLVMGGSTLTLEGELVNTGSFEVQDNATLAIKYAFTNPAAQLFAGTEVFEANSEIIVEKWPALQPLAGNFISPNSSGYLFGNLTLNTNLSNNWTICPAGTTYLTAGNFVVQQTGNQSIILTGEGISEVFFGKSVKILAGNVRLQDAGNANAKVVVKEDFHLDGGNFTLSNQSVSTASFQLNVAGNFSVAASAQLINNNTAALGSSSINFNGGKTQQLSVVPAVNTIPLIVKAGTQLQLGASLTLNPVTSANAGSFTVEGGATLEFGVNSAGVPNIISGNAYFTLAAGGTLIINSPEGIMATGNSGNVQVRDTRRSFHSQAIYRYAGTLAQQTGTGLPAATSGKIVIIDNPTTVTLTQSTGISNNTNISADGGRLEIRQGTFITPAGIDVISSGKLVMTGGVYRIHTLNTTVPQLTGAYNLTSGTIELAGNGNQTLRGTTYFQILISGDNSDGLSSKGISTTTTISKKLEIKPSAIFDITNKTLNGDGGLVMTGGTFRIAKVTGTLPELTGNNYPYELTGGTVELYGTGATQSQSIRGNYGNGQKITYYNFQIGAAEANISASLANAVVGSSLEIAGTMRVVAPASLQISSNRSVNGTGNFVLEKGATLFYGAAEGIKQSGTGIYDGNIRVAGSRTFSEEANYGLIGALDMVTGDAFPSRVQNLIVDKSAGAVTLSNTIEITGSLSLQNGIIKTNEKEIFLSADDPAALIKYSATAYIQGILRRTMLKNGSYHFPVGTSAQMHLLMFTPEELSGNGYSNVSVFFSNSDYGTPVSVHENDMYLNTIAEPGVWIVKANASPLSGSYAVTASIDGFKDLKENKFGILLKTPSYGKTAVSTLSDTWTSGDGTTPEAGTEGRTLTGGYASKTGMTSFGTLGIGSEITPLPVTWNHFSAVFEKNAVKTTWSTVSEENNSHFEVERSADGITFYVIGTVEAKNEGTSIANYGFMDENPLTGLSYYRIRQVDFSGESSFTKIVAVNSTGIASLSSNIYPNPAEKEVFVSFTVLVPQTLTISVYDLQGRLLKISEFNAHAGSQVVYLPIQDFISGTYLVKITTSEIQQTHRLIIQ